MLIVKDKIIPLEIPAETKPQDDNLFAHLDLREAVRLLRRRRRPIVAITLAVLLQSFLLALFLTPQYRAESVVMLDPRKTHVVDLGAVVSGLPAENSVLRSEIDIITSRTMIGNVLDKLKLVHDPEFQKHRPFYWLNPFHWFAPVSAAQETQRRNEAEEEIARRLKADNDGRSYSIRIAFESKDPQKAAQIANAFADEYLTDQLDAKYDAAARASNWLSDHLNTLKQQVEASERAVEAFREKAHLIEIDGSTVAARQMDEINSQLIAARGETSQAEARFHGAQSRLQENGGIDAVADVLASPLIQHLREQESEVRQREAELATRYGERHPKMINVRAEYRDLQNKIAEEVKKIVEGLGNETDIARSKEQQLEKDLQDLEARAGEEMKATVTLRQLQREADANRTLYESFLNRFKQTSEQQELQLADSRIIARAEAPAEASFPRVSLFLLIGGILGVIFGVILACLVEYFDRGFRGAEQVEEWTGLKAIGLVPSLKGATDRPPEDYVADKPLSAYSESLRTIYTALRLMNGEKPPKILMVTSALPNEGKTTFCLSLARSLAKAGNKILLIDTDLRRPRVAKVMGAAPDKNDLAGLLRGEASLNDILRHDAVTPTLAFIGAEGKTHNAQDLLGSQVMVKLLQEAAPHYDLIILDTPPVMAVSDAAIIARLADTSVFLIRWAATPRNVIMQAIKQLTNMGGKIGGAVITQVNLNEHAKYGYGDYGYYYGRYREYYSE